MKLLQLPLGQSNTVSVNSDHSKLVTGGSSELQIYNLKELIEYVQLDPPPKLTQLNSIKPIHTIKCHNDVINCVQFLPNSSEFVSADAAGYIYHHTTSTTPLQIYPFGNKPASAIVDISISPQGDFLAWSTITGEVNFYNFTNNKFHQLTPACPVIQTSIAFDPTNNYLITIGDDTIIHMYQYTSTPYKFRHISKISRLLNKNRRNVKYKRISWSPEGELVAIPTASKNQTLVISLISHSNNWNTSISLVGHDSTCQVVGFNPKLYQQEDSVYSIVASGDGDGTVCVWNTTKDSPIVVLKNLGDDIKDMCWVSGDVLIWCGGEKGIYMGKFDSKELGDEVEKTEFEKLVNLQKSVVKDIGYNYEETWKRGTSREIDYIEEANGIDITQSEKVSDKVDIRETSPVDTSTTTPGKGKITPSVLPPPDLSTPPPTDILDSAMITRKSPAKIKPKSLPSTTSQPKITMKNGKRRIQPMLISSTNSAQATPAVVDTPVITTTTTTSMEFDKPSSAISTEHIKKRPTTDQPSKKRQQLEPIKFIGTPIVNPAIAISQIRLATRKTKLHFQCTSQQLLLDVKNGSGNETQPTRITCIKKEKPIWTDFVSKHVGLVTCGDEFFAIALTDGNIIIYSQISGIRIFPTLVLGSQISFLESCNKYLLAVTNTGELFVWDISAKKSVLNTTIIPLLDLGRYDNEEGLSKSDHITLCAVTTTGIPLITLSNGNGYMYNSSLGIWQTVSESWWCFGSHYWNSTGSGSSSIIDMLEHHTNEEILRKTRLGRGKLFNKINKNMIMKEGFESLENTISINHLENRIKCAEILGESEEFKKWFMVYVERLCELGLKLRLFEVCSELMGPTSKENPEAGVNGIANGNSTPPWNPTICGWDKQTLLKDIITTCSIHRDAQRVLIHFGELIGLV
ncbi:Protein HIR2 [Spathaspora sp. JA1]|nr:Protein HIR2 [Spathaspora sp. JA1]